MQASMFSSQNEARMMFDDEDDDQYQQQFFNNMNGDQNSFQGLQFAQPQFIDMDQVGEEDEDDQNDPTKRFVYDITSFTPYSRTKRNRTLEIQCDPCVNVDEVVFRKKTSVEKKRTLLDIDGAVIVQNEYKRGRIDHEEEDQDDNGDGEVDNLLQLVVGENHNIKRRRRRIEHATLIMPNPHPCSGKRARDADTSYIVEQQLQPQQQSMAIVPLAFGSPPNWVPSHWCFPPRLAPQLQNFDPDAIRPHNLRFREQEIAQHHTYAPIIPQLEDSCFSAESIPAPRVEVLDDSSSDEDGDDNAMEMTGAESSFY